MAKFIVTKKWLVEAHNVEGAIDSSNSEDTQSILVEKVISQK